METFNREKFRRMVQYIANRGREDETLGVTKLNKLLFYIDFTAYRELGRSISGVDYEHWPEGPVPQNMDVERAEMKHEGRVSIEEVDYHGKRQQRVFTHHQPNMYMFTADELAIIDRVLERFHDWTATRISDLSHRELGWRLTEHREIIPYRTTWLSSRPLNEEQIAAGKDIAEKHGLLDPASI